MLETLDTTDLRDFLDAHIQVLIAEANEAGFGTGEILAALRDIVEEQRIAHDADPDPAEDPYPRHVRAVDQRSRDDAAADIDTEAGVPRAG